MTPARPVGTTARPPATRSTRRDGAASRGDDTTTRHATPVPVVGLDAPATAIAAAASFTCAALEDGRVMCWGDNGGGQLGVAASDDHSAPVEVPLPR